MHAQAQPEGYVNGSATAFQDLQVYPITMTLNRTALLNGFTYYLLVEAGTAYPQHPSTQITSTGIMVRPRSGEPLSLDSLAIPCSGTHWPLDCWRACPSQPRR